MALGGGTFTVQNKVLPGAYINIVSTAAASATLSDRGVAAIAMPLDWGKVGDVIELTGGDLQKSSLKLLGYDYTDEKLKGLREIFANAVKVYVYRLDSNGAKAAENEFAKAKYPGARGNDIKIVIAANVDDETLFDVSTIIGVLTVQTQTVAKAADLVDNNFVIFKKDANLTVTAATPLTGGVSGEVNAAAHQAFLDKIEKYSFNALGCAASDSTIKSLYVNFTKRLRDEVGKKFQTVLYNKAADYEGVVNVKNKVIGSESDETALVYWVTGVVAGTAVNKSALNKVYDGEYTPDVEYTQSQLEAAIRSGEFTLHQVGDDIRVLNDINSLVTTSDTKGDIFKENQTMRVVDQIANDIAVLFDTKYLGVVPNDKAGRISLWSDIVKHHQDLQKIRAIENFSDSDVVVDQGDSKKSVVVSDAVTVINAMEKLYMTVTVS